MDSFAIGWGILLVRSMLGVGWWRVLEALKSLVNAPMHGDINVVFIVVLVKGQTVVVAADMPTDMV